MRPMKDSGVEWLGEVPEEWDVRRLGNLLSLELDQTVATPVYELDDLESWTGRLVNRTKPLEKEEAKGGAFKVGDVLFGKLRPYLAKSWLAENDGVAVGDIYVLRSSELVGRYFSKFFQSREFIDIVNSNSYGSKMPRINWSQLRNIEICLPSLKEQGHISEHLDQETSRIDTLISKKEQLIEKLLERRQALITQVVTKGLDPNVPMKDSGVEWLGKLPQAWSVGKLSYYTSIKLGKMVQKDESVGGKFIPYLSAISIQNEYLDDATDKKMWASPIDFTSLSLLRNDLLVVEGGMAGMTAHLAADFPNIIFQNSLNRVRVHQEMMVSRFVFYWLNSLRYRGLIESICNKATIMHLTREKLASLPIVCPPRQKQIGIAAYLDKETSQIDSLVEKTRRAIELLKERRQALITQVVTGKIDVRGFAGGNS
jgi:type I restriction enzyme S subunit